MRATTLAVGLVAAVIGCDKKGGGGAAPTELEGEAATVTAADLYAAYKGNVAAADAKYLGKKLKVTGRVLDVEQGPDGGYVVGIETGPNIMPSGQVLKAAVTADVGAAARDSVGKIKNFDTVAVVGKCAGREDAPGRMGNIRVRLTAASLASHTPK